MTPIVDVEQRVAELFDRYTSAEFKGLCAVDKGYHLVRALDEEVYKGLFKPWNAEVNFITRGREEIVVKVSGYHARHFSLRISDKPNE